MQIFGLVINNQIKLEEVTKGERRTAEDILRGGR